MVVDLNCIASSYKDYSSDKGTSDWQHLKNILRAHNVRNHPESVSNDLVSNICHLHQSQITDPYM